MRPNLFHHATSELSQDAVLCWMLSWAKPEYKTADPLLHQVGLDLIFSIYEGAGISVPPEINRVNVKKQQGNIDILCVINETTAIIIEDKAGTREHSDQLARYKTFASVNRGFPTENVIPVYVQTGDQSDYGQVERHGYQILLRRGLLAILESVNGTSARRKSDILDSFAEHLRSIEDEVQSFLVRPFSEWKWNAWKGFYSRLQTELPGSQWAYVANASGGFLGFYWHSRKLEHGNVYLLLDHVRQKLCFKITAPETGRRTHLRETWYRNIESTARRHGLNIQKPARFRSGGNMTVALLTKDFREMDALGKIDMPATIRVLVQAEQLLDECVAAAESGDLPVGLPGEFAAEAIVHATV